MQGLALRADLRIQEFTITHTHTHTHTHISQIAIT